MSLSLFHPIIREWFNGRFEAPTEAQAKGWTAISEGRHTLIAAPTGSGKTLAAFLTCIDGLVRAGMEGSLPDTTQVVYVSPLKALSNDIQKNLAAPLEEIQALAEESGSFLPDIRTAVRTGDTKASERQRMAKKPPHILITTPESLYILLTSKSGRRALAGVKTLILDEIHAVADDKRGSHLTLSVERLCNLAEGPVTRIGLSATQRPIEEMARFLVGNDNIGEDGTPDCLIVDSGHARNLDLAIELPPRELGPIASHEQWAETLDDIADLIRSHGTTLVFVNTRRMVERIAHQLSQRLGDEAVVAHHGSLSRTTRLAAEEKLKHGEVKVCVATASLELGIDIGVVDLVCQIGSSRSIAVMLQRVGRSGHTLLGTPKGRLFPLTRDELVECTALMRAIRNSNLDSLVIPPWPLDILAQQMAAACAAEEWDEDELLDLCRRAYPYRDLPKSEYDRVVEMLSEGFAPRLGRNGALLHRDGVNRRLKGRRGAGIAAMTSGGAIPDTGDYDVIADPEETFVGTVNEDFAIESMAGDVFLLGNTPWKIRRIESGRVRVVDADGQAPSIPFWLGEAPGRTRELSEEVSELRDGIDRRLDNPAEAEMWIVQETGVSAEAARQLVAYFIEGKRVLGMVPTKRRVVAERFFDDSGGMQLVVHAPFGSQINRAWGMALRKQICRTFDFELQAAATDDGLNFSLGPSMSFPLEDVFSYISPRNAEEVVMQAVFQAPLFGVRWRWDAARSLAVLRHTGGRKVPIPLLRMRSEDLLAAVFPAQVACQDNAPPGDIEPPDHPLVFETIRDCLTEAMDAAGLKEVLTSIESGEIEVYARDTVQPSVFSHQLLNTMPYAFLDDAPLEERRSRAVPLRRALPDDTRDLGRLDPEAIHEESNRAWPTIRDADELHDALMHLVALPLGARLVRDRMPGAGDGTGLLDGWFRELVHAGRAFRLQHGSGETAWVATERVDLALTIYPESRLEPPPGNGFATTSETDRDDAMYTLLRGWVECSGPFTTEEMRETLGLSDSDVKIALARFENEGVILRGQFRSGSLGEEFCDRRILARIHRATIGRLRREIRPVTPADFVRFLLRWQCVEPGRQLQGEGGVEDVIEKLQGFEAAAQVWESDILPSRISDYAPSMLDGLCFGGEVIWGRLTRHSDNGHASPTRSPLSRATPITLALRESLDWLLDGRVHADDDITGGAGEVLELLQKRGASFPSELQVATGRLPSDVEEALWLLAAAGLVTSDGMATLRQRIKGNSDQGRRALRARRAGSQRRGGYSRWSVLEPPNPVTDTVEAKARQLLRRYGVLFPDLLAREPMAPRWRDLTLVLRRLEARGEIRGGLFVSGFMGEQFALPEAVEMLRSVRGIEPSGQMVTVSACDPLNVAGILTPGDRAPAVPGNRVVFRDGVPVCSLESGKLVVRAKEGDPGLARARSLLQNAPYREAAADLARV